MLSANNILSPAHGSPLATPSQDMVLGSYYLTYGPDEEGLAELRELEKAGKWDEKKHGKRPHVYRSAQEAELSYEAGVVKLHDLAEHRPRHTTEHTLTTVGRIIFNERVERALESSRHEFDPATYSSWIPAQEAGRRGGSGSWTCTSLRHGARSDAFKTWASLPATGITISQNTW